ncbi:MAG: helix-turn-helix domain-containing protein, partial [Rubrobacter sp.]|nr:helix-turn-helix domain-containing protein [Rubrobacter sp.]
MSDLPPPNNDFTPEPGTLVIEDQSLRYGFVQLPKQVLWAGNLSRDAKLLYAVLLGYAWQEASCFPGYDRLSLDMGATRKIVRKYMQELEAIGLVAQKRRGLGLTNLYRLPDLRTARLDIPERFKPTHPEGSKTTHQELPRPERPQTTHPDGAKTPRADGSKSTRKVEAVKEDPVELEFESSNLRKRSDDADNQEDDAPGSFRSRLATSARSAEDKDDGNGLTPLGATLQARYSGRGRPPREYSEDRQAILAFVQDFAR